MGTSNSKQESVEDLSKLKVYLNLPHLDEILRESKSLDVLVLGDLRDSSIVDGLIGLKLSEMSRSSITTDDGAEDIVVYTARREGIDVTVWNAPSLSFHQVGYVQEIKKILETVDMKLLYTGHCPDKDVLITVFKHIMGAFGSKCLNNSVIVFPSSDFSIALSDILLRQFIHQFDFVRNSVIGGVHISTIFLKGTHDKIVIIHPEVSAPYAHWLSGFFFKCVRLICSQNAKGALLRLNLKRFNHIPEGTKSTSVVSCPVEEQPLTSPVFLRALRCGLISEDDSVLVSQRELLATEPQPPPEEAEDKSEPVQELTHFYTGTHDLQFGAHGGGAQATPSGEPPAVSDSCILQ